MVSKSSKVYLVGAGPGDPALVTLKTVECLRQAEVIIYDYLANEELLALAPPEAERIKKKKKAAPDGAAHFLPVRHTMPPVSGHQPLHDTNHDYRDCGRVEQAAQAT